jgi:hypothetical protein
VLAGPLHNIYWTLTCSPSPRNLGEVATLASSTPASLKGPSATDLNIVAQTVSTSGCGDHNNLSSCQ